MIYCNPLQKEHQKQIDELYRFYNEETDLPKYYGEFIRDGGDSDTNRFIRNAIHQIGWDKNEKPLESFLPEKGGKLNQSYYTQIKIGLKNWDRSVKKGGVGGFEALFRAPMGIYKPDPNMQRWSQRFSNANNAEKRNQRMYSDSLSSIASRLHAALYKHSDKKLTLKQASKKLSQLSDEYWNASINGDQDAAATVHEQMSRVLGTEDSRNVLRSFVALMENFNTSDLDKMIENPRLAEDIIRNANIDIPVAKELFGIVRDSKKLMNDMGNVNIAGLEKTKDIIDTVYDVTSTNEHPSASRYKRQVDSAIERMTEAIKEDKYFPHYGIESLIRLEDAIDKVNFLRIRGDASYADRALREISDNLTIFTQEVLSAATNEKKRAMFEMDPIKVMETYSKNAIAYNKKQFVTDAFLKAVKDIRPTKSNFDQMNDAIEYLSHKYIAINKGFIDASESIKQASAFVSRAQTMSKMGLSLTGALRNSTQWFWYAVKKGFKRYRRGKKAFNSDEAYDFGDRKLTMRKMISEAKQADESGYFFDNMSNVSLETISKGALFNVDGVEKNSFRFDFDENGAPVVRYVKDGIGRKFDLKMAEFTGKSLIFHRKTENWVRKAVYENSFADYFAHMHNNSEYMNAQIEQHGRKKAMENLRRDAHNIALNWVMSTQFEYSTGGRALMYGGGTTNASVIGNTTFQFFPYASSMFEYNTGIIRDGWDSMKMGDFQSYQVGAAARLIGFQVFGIGLATILFNNNFRYIIENDTWSRLEKLFSLMTNRNTEETFGNGMAAILSGPIVSDMLFWMEVGGLTDFSRSEIGELALGYYDYANKADNDKTRMAVNRVSVSLAKLYKSQEAFARGDIMSMLRNQLLAYPSDFTREGHEYLMNTLGIDTGRQRRRSTVEEVRETIHSMPDDQRQKVLSIIEELKERGETDRGVPAGLQNFTIR